MERYNGVELDPEGAFVYYDDAQRALDAERERVKELEEWQRVVVGTGTDQEAVVRMAATEYTKTAVQCWKDENAKLTAQLATLQAQLRQVEGQSKQQAEEAVIVFAKYTTLRQLVEALPVVDGQMDVAWGACYYIRSFVAGQYGVVCGLITEQSTAMAIKTLLEYRAALVAQDVHHPTEERHE